LAVIAKGGELQAQAWAGAATKTAIVIAKASTIVIRFFISIFSSMIL